MVLTLGVAGCATRGGEQASQTMLPPPQLAATEVELEMPQTQLQLSYLDGSDRTMGVSFGVLIDLLQYAARYGAAKAKAQRNFRNIERLRDGASTAGVKQRIKTLLDESLAEVDWLSSQTSVLIEIPRADPEIDARAKATEGDAYLRVQAVYAIDTDLDAVRVMLIADLRPNNKFDNTAAGTARRNQPRWQRKQTVSAVLYLPQQASRPKRQAAWLDDDSALLAEALLIGTAVATDSLRQHLQTIADAPQATGAERDFVDPTGAKHSDFVPAQVIRDENRTSVLWDDTTRTVYLPLATGT